MREFERALQKARTEAAQLNQERTALLDRIKKIDARIVELSQLIEPLTKLVGPTTADKIKIDSDRVEVGGPGLMEACMRVLKGVFPKALTVLEIRRNLQLIGFDAERYSNPTAAVSTTMGRLVARDTVSIEIVHGKKAYSYRVPRWT